MLLFVRYSFFNSLLTFAIAGATTLPVIFEPAQNGAGYLARTGAGAVSVSPVGVQFDSKVALIFDGATTRASAQASQRLPGSSNYFHGTQSRTGVPHYGRVLYRGVYPGIDVVYYGNASRLEYDFELSPGAHPERIRLRFNGARTLGIDGATGDLIVTTNAGGVIRQHAPRVFQKQQTLETRYVVHPATQTVTLAIDRYDAALPLTIDPVIESATYLGGGSFEAARAVKVDAQGAVYLAGQAPSPGIFSSSPFSSASNSGTDAVLIKFIPQLNTIASYTFLGGDQDDIAYSLAIDSTGAAYLTGSTRSINFPVTNGFQMNPGGGAFPDGFVAKVSPDGRSLVYASYLGGSGFDEAYAIAVDPATGTAYVCGATGSRNFPVTSGAFQTAFGGTILSQSTTGFVTVIAPAGNKLLRSTLYGGSRQDQVRAVALDQAGFVYAGGNTSSPDFPVRGPAVQPLLPGLTAGFVAKLSNDLSQPVYSTFLGGQSSSSVNALVVDQQGSAVAAGYTSSPDFPVRAAIQPSFGGGNRDAFVTRLTPQGNDYLFSTYLGGADSDTINDMVLDANGVLTVAGATASADFPQKSSLQPYLSKSPNQAAFLTKIQLPVNTLLFSTLVGGSADNQAFGVALDPSGATYLAGVTSSTDFPVKQNAYQTQYGGGGGDMFLIRLSADANGAGALPPLNVSPAVISLAATSGATTPAPSATINVTPATAATAAFTVDWTTQSSTNWLTATPTRADAPSTVTVFANPSGLAIGVYSGSVRLTPANGGAPVVIPVTLSITNPPPVAQSVTPAKVAAGAADTQFTISGSGFTNQSVVQVFQSDGTLVQSLTPDSPSDSATIRFTLSHTLLFRDTLLAIAIKDPSATSASNTLTIQVGDRFPTIAPGGIVNAASNLSADTVAPGEYISINGSTLGPSVALRALFGDGGAAATSLGAVTVWFDSTPAPLLSVSDSRVIAVAPFALAGRQSVQVSVQYQGVRSNPVALSVTQAAPGLFTADGSGVGLGLIFNDTGLSNAAFNPASKNSVISLYLTGAGLQAPAATDGLIAATASSGPSLPVAVTIDGVPCDFISAVSAIGQVNGMVHVKVRVPSTVRSGAALPIMATVGGVSSQPGVVIAVQ